MKFNEISNSAIWFSIKPRRIILEGKWCNVRTHVPPRTLQRLSHQQIFDFCSEIIFHNCRTKSWDFLGVLFTSPHTFLCSSCCFVFPLPCSPLSLRSSSFLHHPFLGSLPQCLLNPLFFIFYISSGFFLHQKWKKRRNVDGSGRFSIAFFFADFPFSR